MTDPRPPHDVDALARRLPRHEPVAERSAAMRHAVLDAAPGPSAPAARGPMRGWWLGLAAAAATACAWLILRTPDRPPPAAPPAQSVAASRAAAVPVTAPPAAAESERIPDGVTTFAAAHPLQLARGDATITAPPDARFEVEVRGDQVQRVTVTAGWVVVAGSHAKATIVAMRHTWTPEPPAPEPVPAATTSPSATASTASPAAPAANRVTSAPPDARPPADAVPREAGSASRAEHDFRDGLRTLLAGDPRGATEALDRACSAPSSSQDESCYWAALAWLRSGDRGHALRAFTDMLSRWPGSSHAGEANVALGWLLLEIGDRSAARTHFAAAAADRMPSVRASAVRGLTASQ